MMAQDHDYEKQQQDESEEFFDKAAGGSISAVDKTLFTLLKDLRKKISKKENLPPFVIFQDPSLEDMCIQYPIHVDELKNVTGVGTGKAQKYGQPFVDLIKKYVKENEIERPIDMVVKSTVNKSGLKVYIIQNIDRKVDLEDIAYNKGILFDELLSEIERIVASGTKIDLNYYLNQFIDLQHQEAIMEYFHSASTDSIKDALQELGEDEFTEEEIRLLRIKFMSEVGN